VWAEAGRKNFYKEPEELSWWRMLIAARMGGDGRRWDERERNGVISLSKNIIWWRIMKKCSGHVALDGMRRMGEIIMKAQPLIIRKANVCSTLQHQVALAARELIYHGEWEGNVSVSSYVAYIVK